MFIKNNSNLEWPDYNCGGGHFVTIKAGSVIEVDDGIGDFLLRVLGAPNWLVETTDKEDIKVAVKGVRVDETIVKKLKKEEEKKAERTKAPAAEVTPKRPNKK